MGKFIDFGEVEELATIEQLAQMLNLDAKKSGRQLRSACPVHGGDDRTIAITPDVKSRRGSMGVFFCQAAKEGGDRIGLVAHCMEIGQQDAAFFIQEQFGTGTVEGTVQDSTVSKTRATVPQNDRRTEPTVPTFDPVAFAAKLTTPDGVTDDDAKTFRVGMYRNALYVPAVYESGVVAGYWKVQDGKLVAPKTWLPDQTNVVQLKRPA